MQLETLTQQEWHEKCFFSLRTLEHLLHISSIEYANVCYGPSLMNPSSLSAHRVLCSSSGFAYDYPAANHSKSTSAL
jgi:hypothetical protein